MAAAASGAPERTRERQPRKAETGLVEDVKQVQEQAQKKVSPLLEFWQKVNNDWVFNFSGTLAYGFLTSIGPILLVILAIGGLILGAISAEAYNKLISSIAGALPNGGAGATTGIENSLNSLKNSAVPILVVGIVTAIIGGSGLFVTMEGIFGVIFRLRSRDFIHQRIMAIGMLLILAVLVPIMILASTIPPAILGLLHIGDTNPVAGFFIQLMGVAVAFVTASVLFGAIYIVVPNKPVRIGEAWRGTAVAAALLVIYEILFPIYESNFLHTGSLGAVVGFAVVIMIFFYYLAFILLLGAEVNSWFAGQRPTAAPIDAILHELQAHNTTRGAAGPTAGQPQEDLQDHKGASAMRDTHAAIEHEREEHQGDAQPPKYAESGAAGNTFSVTPGRGLSGNDRGAIPLGALARDDVSHDRPPKADVGEAHSGAIIADERPLTPSSRHRQEREARDRPLTPSQRSTLAALAAAGAVALTGAVQFVRALLATGRDRDRTPATD